MGVAAFRWYGLTPSFALPPGGIHAVRMSTFAPYRTIERRRVPCLPGFSRWYRVRHVIPREPASAGLLDQTIRAKSATQIQTHLMRVARADDPAAYKEREIIMLDAMGLACPAGYTYRGRLGKAVTPEPCARPTAQNTGMRRLDIGCLCGLCSSPFL